MNTGSPRRVGLLVGRERSFPDALIAETDAGVRKLGLQPMCAWQPKNPSGILAFQHSRSAELHAALERENVHVMHHAGRIRIAIHGYNTADDVRRLLQVLSTQL